MGCPRCGSRVYYECVMTVQGKDGSKNTAVFRQCDACHYIHDEVVDGQLTLFK
jgi:cytochrome c2